MLTGPGTWPNMRKPAACGLCFIFSLKNCTIPAMNMHVCSICMFQTGVNYTCYIRSPVSQEDEVICIRSRLCTKQLSILNVILLDLLYHKRKTCS